MAPCSSSSPAGLEAPLGARIQQQVWGRWGFGMGSLMAVWAWAGMLVPPLWDAAPHLTSVGCCSPSCLCLWAATSTGCCCSFVERLRRSSFMALGPLPPPGEDVGGFRAGKRFSYHLKTGMKSFSKASLQAMMTSRGSPALPCPAPASHAERTGSREGWPGLAAGLIYCFCSPGAQQPEAILCLHYGGSHSQGKLGCLARSCPDIWTVQAQASPRRGFCPCAEGGVLPAFAKHCLTA